MNLYAMENRALANYSYYQEYLPWLPRANDEMNKATALDGKLLLQHFYKATAHLKYPKIRIPTAVGVRVVVYLCGERSRNVGGLQIALDVDADLRTTYLGAITPAGVVQLKPAARDYQDLVNNLLLNPVDYLATVGKKTSCCCFCGKLLSTAESLTAGYGPICADHFGLPWGEC